MIDIMVAAVDSVFIFAVVIGISGCIDLAISWVITFIFGGI